MGAFPCTADFLHEQASREPTRLALHDAGAELTYGDLDLLVRRCRQELRALGVGAGERIAVDGTGTDVAVQVVLLLAAESLGCVTASVSGREPAASAVLAQVDRVFTADAGLACACAMHRIDPSLVASWKTGVADEAGAGLAASQPARLTSTSGSSGRPRLLLLSHAVLDRRIGSLLEVPGWDLGPGTRMVVLAPLVVNASYLRICGCLRHGGAVLIGPGSALAALAPTHVCGLPAQVDRLLRELPPGSIAPQPVAVATFGGHVSSDLASRVRAVLGATIETRYGTNETSTVCIDMDATGSGTLSADVSVRILDDAGDDLPPGAAGVIAVQSPAMVDGYLDDAEATARAFRAGWFLTGDMGRLVAPRRLQLLGRYDDLLVTGGLKVPASLLEDALRGHAFIADCAVLALHGDDRADAAVVAVLRQGDSTQDAGSQLSGALQQWPELRLLVVVMPALPRLASGKVDRLQLLRQLRRTS